MSTLTIRIATVRDYEQLVPLLAGLRGPVPAEEADVAAHVFYRYVVRADARIQVAELDGRIISFCSLEFREKLGKGNPYEAWIPDLFVDPEHRRLGAARAILDRAFALARGRGCSRLVLESGYQRREAHQLYTNVGMTDSGKYFVIEFEA